MRVVWRALCVIVVLALQIVIVASPGFEPDAAAQVTCSAGNESQLAICINGASGYNNATLDTTIRLTADISLSGDLPIINNSAASPPKLTIDGQGHFIDGNTVASDILEQDAGDTTITNIWLTDAASSGAQNDGGAMTILNSTFSNNNGDNGVLSSSPEGTTIINSTFAYNSVGIGMDEPTTVISSTIVHNSAHGIYSLDALTIGGSLIAANTTNCFLGGGATVTPTGGNISDDAVCTLPVGVGLNGTFSAVLEDNGCTAPCAKTIELFGDSVAVDYDTGCAAGLTDQRGFARTTGACDAGAFEAGDCPATSVTVTDEAELAFAITCYNGRSAPTEILFANDIVLTDIIPAIDNTAWPPLLTIDGQGYSLDGNSVAFWLLRQANGVTLITDLTMTASLGDAVLHEGGQLEIANSTVVSNVLVGVYANSPSPTVIKNSTFDANMNGVYATAVGSAIVQSSTLVRNQNGLAGLGSIDAGGSLVSDNVVTDCSVLILINSGGNVYGDNTCTGTATPGLAGTLGPLADNGCTAPCTQTVALPAGSPAIDADTACAAGLVDQRGVTRTAGACDAGAYEAAISTATCNGLAVTIDLNLGASGTGTAGDDVIFGTPGPDVIDGMGGNDTICGEAGNDDINGSAGVDFIFGGEGDDTILGGDGNDRIRGQQGIDNIGGNDGNDFLYGGIDGDTIFGGDGNDTIGGFGGADNLNGGPGNDKIFGGFGADTITGGMDNDTIRGLIGNDTITGGPGDDDLNGDNGLDTINGSAGNDIIRGGNSVDTLFGDDGDDSVNGGKSDDALSGGNGTDTCTGNTGTDTADATCEAIFGVP